MDDLFGRLSSGDVLPVIITSIFFGTVLIVTLTAIISRCVYKIRRDANSALLKQDMLDRGMSAEEIKLVLEATPKS